MSKYGLSKIGVLKARSTDPGDAGKWVALSEDNANVYAFGETAKKAADNVRAKGYTEFTLLFVQPFDLLYVG